MAKATYVGTMVMAHIDGAEMRLDRSELDSVALVAEQTAFCDVAHRPLAVVR
jgi:hypothetical protein